MLLKKAEPKKEVIEENPYDWPESYYMEIDAGKRKALLETQISSGDDSRENQLRMELWEARYKQQKKGDYADNFMYWLLELLLLTRQMNKTIGKKGQKKQAVKALDMFCINRMEYFGKDLIAAELKHLILAYGVLCMEDKSYGNIILGFGKMKKSSLERKVLGEYIALGEQLPEYLDMTEEFLPLSQAIQAAKRHLGLS